MSYIPLLNIAPVSGPFRWPVEVDLDAWEYERLVKAQEEERLDTDD